jgi:hypothetical protein
MVIVRYYVYVRVFNWQMYLEIIEFGDSPIFKFIYNFKIDDIFDVRCHI